MPSNPMKIRFDEPNLQWLEQQSEITGKTITRLVNDNLRTLSQDVEGERLLECLELPAIVRLKSSSTTMEVQRLITLFGRRTLQRIVFAVREDNLNNFCMVVLLETEELTVLADNININHARRPRILEVRELFKSWDRMDLLDKTFFIPQLIPSTSKLSDVEAEKVLRSLATRSFELMEYLQLLGAHRSDIRIHHYMADRGYKVRLFRKYENSLYEPDDNEPIYEETFDSEDKARAHYERIILSSGGATEGNGSFWLEISGNGRFIFPGAPLNGFVLPSAE